MLPITGYVDRLSARPGETLEFKIDCREASRFEARLVRVRCGDPNPDGPGIRETELPDVFSGTFAGRRQDCNLGSYIRVPRPAVLDTLNSFTVTANLWPTTPTKSGQGLIARDASGGPGGFGLMLDGDAGVTVVLGDTRLSTGMSLKRWRWYRVWASYDAERSILEVGHQALDRDMRDDRCCTTLEGVSQPDHAGCGDLFIGSRGGDPVEGHYNGKIERPLIIDRAISPGRSGSLELPVDALCVADWDFSIDIPGLRAIDVGPHRLHGTLVNMPARAMTGPNWTGDEPNWRHAPDQYGSIHFHDDDIHDCGWDTDFTFTVPDGLRSGVYAMRIKAGEHEDMIPFFVRPRQNETTSRICVLVPTFTYVIYANHARGNTTDATRQLAAEWGARPWTPDDHPEYGLSTYNFHNDGSGICHASSLRPMITMRSGFLSIPELPGSGLRHFPADTHLFDWLEEMGHDFDVITDHDLHLEGLKAIEPYPVVMTCTHPEYHTDRTFEAVRAYTENGGRLMYLGGNGFYWRIATHRDTDGVLEIRRGEVGMRAWAAEPGEFFQAFDGNYGGLWRRTGKPPNVVMGIGFSSQGKFEAGHFRRKPASYDERVGWIFEGIDEEIIGDFGLNGQGAAGYELDRADHRLGTPEDAIVLATSENLPDSYVVVPEDLLSHVLTWNGESVSDLIRADMVYLEKPGGGRVFSVGSITFCGSLPHNDYDNNVSRLIGNVLRGFLEN